MKKLFCILLSALLLLLCSCASSGVKEESNDTGRAPVSNTDSDDNEEPKEKYPLYIAEKNETKEENPLLINRIWAQPVPEQEVCYGEDSELTIESVVASEFIAVLEFTVSGEMYRETRYTYPDEELLENYKGTDIEAYKELLTESWDCYVIPVEVADVSLNSEEINVDEITVLSHGMIFGDSVIEGARFLGICVYHGADSSLSVSANPNMLYYITEENTILPVCNRTLLREECRGKTVEEFKKMLSDIQQECRSRVSGNKDAS